MQSVCAIEGLDPATYTRHGLHDAARNWPETNCYVDLLIEVLAQRGHDPRAALAFTVAQDYEGDQFTFFKVPSADLALLYGVEILELAIFDQLEDHARVQLARGRLPLIEVDSYYLPDTRGITYRRSHSKTTIGVNVLDSANRRLDYFHNAGYFRLEGEDFDALLRPAHDKGLPLFPYVEFIKFGPAPSAREQMEMSRMLLAHHLRRRPAQNPFTAWGEVISVDIARLMERPAEWFHTYAFSTLRQAGANFELLASYLAWLQERGHPAPERARLAAEAIASGTKVMQFQFARASARGRVPDVTDAIRQLATDYDIVLDGLANDFVARGTAL
ncbi:protein of unknown function [Bradyrhizobium sp. NFR13]|uniref:DUF1839 family protein n=1 Tax=Bradyrhizobium sp. NFR13 TaxID=1566285 RepID=UPI0008EBC22F|nr:DUF1839 family protein [Bradyrhizobium sp. NFR13]SFL97185.1 protein of unknown function [Bradyrhizobium sp. NFR13]